MKKIIFSQIESAEIYCSKGDYRRAMSILNDVSVKAKDAEVNVSVDIKRIYSRIIDEVGSHVNEINYNWSIEIADDTKRHAEDMGISQDKLNVIYKSSLPFLVKESESFFSREKIYEAVSVAKKCKEIAEGIGEEVDEHVTHIIRNYNKEPSGSGNKHFFMLSVGGDDGYCLASKFVILNKEE